MRTEEFQRRVEALRETIIEAIDGHFRDSIIGFDRRTFLEDAGYNIRQMSKDAYFYGAQVFPEPLESSLKVTDPQL